MADSMSAQQRARVWNQRLSESTGGEAGSVFGAQIAMTAMVCSYTLMRKRGFSILPLSVRTLPSLGGLLLVGFGGNALGKSYSG